MPNRRRRFALAAALLLGGAAAGAQTAVTAGEDLHVDVSAARGELVINLLGDLWSVPVGGGVATRLAESAVPANRPRWSPDARQLAFATDGPGENRVWVLDLDTERQRALGGPGTSDRDPAWHPSGERLTYASSRDARGYDLWEIDLATGLEWRLTRHPAQDVEPSWSADGRNLAWIRHAGGLWSLMLRRFGQPPEVLARSDSPLAAPSWRPDGTLITYFREHDGRHLLQMMILSEPPLERTLADEAGLYPAPVAWLDRDRLYYSTGEGVRSRGFDEWRSRKIAFRASPGPVADLEPAFETAARELPLVAPAIGEVVYRADRLFDGHSRNYRPATDVLVRDGVIAAVTARKDWGDLPIVELPMTTLLPGFVDVHSRLPPGDPADAGAGLLAWGVTTLVARVPDDFDPSTWEGPVSPGPRLLPSASLQPPPAGDDQAAEPLPFLVVADGSRRAGQDAAELTRAWQALGVPVLAEDWSAALRLDSFLVAAAQPASAASNGRLGARPVGFRRRILEPGRRQLVSGLADRRTDGIAALLSVRQVSVRDRNLPRGMRMPLLADLRRSRAPVALGSASNGFPPGLGVHAEFLALAAGGLAGDQVMKAAGRNAAWLLGLEGVVGEIGVGARADLVFVNGDPLADVADARNLVAVVRNGRFFSLVNLLERAAQSVE